MKRTNSKKSVNKPLIEINTKPSSKAKINPYNRTKQKVKVVVKENSHVKARTDVRAKAEPSTKLSSADTLSIKNIHTMTKELIATLNTVDKSLVLIAQLMAMLDKYNINLKTLNSKELSEILKKLNSTQLEKALQIFQKPEVLGLIKALSNSTQAENDNTAS